MNARRLIELDGEFRQREGQEVLTFLCPSCMTPNGHTHSIVVGWTPPSLFPSGAIWKKTGDTVDTVTINPSINCNVPWTDPEDGTVYESDCKFHGWVKDGVVTW